jgi:hypothetical protein
MGLFNRESQTATHDIDLAGATSAAVHVSMKAGELFLRGGASGLLHGEFVYDEHLAPQLDHQQDGERATLTIVQSQGRRLERGGKNRWDLALSDAIPLVLDLRLAAGRCEGHLASAQVASVEVDQEAGDLSLDLGGHQLALTAVAIRQTAGKTHLALTGDYARLHSLRLSATTGDSVIDLSGSAWGSDLDASISVTTGATTLRLPADVGVEVRAGSMLGKVSAHGLTRDGNMYRNAAFGTTPVMLRFDVQASVGKVTLEVSG